MFALMLRSPPPPISYLKPYFYAFSWMPFPIGLGRRHDRLCLLRHNHQCHTLPLRLKQSCEKPHLQSVESSVWPSVRLPAAVASAVSRASEPEDFWERRQRIRRFWRNQLTPLSLHTHNADSPSPRSLRFFCRFVRKSAVFRWYYATKAASWLFLLTFFCRSACSFKTSVYICHR